MKTYTFFDFQKEFPTEKACLEYIFDKRFPNGYVDQETGEIIDLYYTESRKCFTSADGKIQVYPTANTIFHKSSTELVKWFYVVFRMSQSKCGVSAKQIQREIGVTYKTAWRMCHLIRKCLEGDFELFEGVVEVDETYVGGKARRVKRNPTSKYTRTKAGRGTKKMPVVGMVERDGRVRAFVTPDVQRDTVFPLIENNVQKGTTVYTDEYNIYHSLGSLGYNHDTVQHKMDEFARGEVHTNTIEGFWSYLKNGIRGAYKHTSKKYLQLYVNEYAFRWNNRKDQSMMFRNLLGAVCR
ncbi:MAG: IS1595 family transposase [Balneola sp.]|nr:IS1595 family transposase [Balneola sp.]MBO6649856.1 IS1595 family transposase [Balneola sp.]MBO6712419.1 IS1595 family transposase [Balneola sp.]MBO6801430.1 IS1595 family transposase [Balneola sp.]MBO6871756.1 IS1595 family transposase [Balneola sp.]